MFGKAHGNSPIYWGITGIQQLVRWKGEETMFGKAHGISPAEEAASGEDLSGPVDPMPGRCETQALSDVAGIPLLIISAKRELVAGEMVTLVEARDKEGQEHSLIIENDILRDVLLRAEQVGFPVCATFTPSGDGWTVSEEDCGSLFTRMITDGKTPPNLVDFMPGYCESRTLGEVTGVPLAIISTQQLYVGRLATLAWAVDEGGREHFLLIENGALRGALLRAEQVGFPVCATFILSGDGWTVSEEDCGSPFTGMVADGKIPPNLADFMPGLCESRTLGRVARVPLAITGIRQLYVGGPATLAWAVDGKGQEHFLLIEDDALQGALLGAKQVGFPVCATFIPGGDGWTVSEEDCGSLFSGMVADGKTPLNLADFMPGLCESRTLGGVAGVPLAITGVRQLYMGRLATLAWAVDERGQKHFLLIENGALQEALANVARARPLARVIFVLREKEWTVVYNEQTNDPTISVSDRRQGDLLPGCGDD